MERKVKRLEGGVKDLDEKGIVKFYFSKFDNKDSDGDIIVKGAFTKTITEGLKRVKHLKNHNIYQVPGVVKEAFEDDHGCVVVSQLALKTDLGRNTYEEYKAGIITEHSFGYDVIKSHKDKEKDAQILTELKLYEVSSLSAWGANPETNVLEIKSLENYLDNLLKLQKGQLTDDRLQQVELEIINVLNHIKSLKSDPLNTQEEPLNNQKEPIEGIKFLRENLIILK